MTPRDPDNPDQMLSTVDRRVLVDLLENGDNVPANIADNIGHSRSAVSTRLGELESEGLVVSKGSGVWTLTMEGLRTAQVLKRHHDGDNSSE